MALRMARTVTPTSAKTASHMEPRPAAARMRMAAFTLMASQTFWRAMRRVRREVETAVAILVGRSGGVAAESAHGDAHIGPL